jgi:hypothetical protein
MIFYTHKTCTESVLHKQLLVYYYRVVYCEDGHFTRADPDQKVLKDIT